MNVINYLMEAHLGLVIVALCYALLLKNNTNFRFQRVYLCMGVLAALVFPLIKIEIDSRLLASADITASRLWLPEFVIGASGSDKTSPAEWSPIKIVLVVYALVSVLLLLKLIGSVVILLSSIAHSNSIKEKDFSIVRSTRFHHTFSFFRYIFLPASKSVETTETQLIIAHERAHVKAMHSLDLIFIEVAKCMLWINPAMHYIQRSVRAVHEFEADRMAITATGDADQYCATLIEETLHHAAYPIASHFSQLNILNRIDMINRKEQRLQPWKIALACLSIAFAFITTACQDRLSNEVASKESGTESVAHLPKEVQEQLTIVRQAQPTAKVVVFEMNEEGEQTAEQLMARLAQQKFATHLAGTVTPDGKEYLIVAYTEQEVQLSASTEVYEKKDVVALPPFGMKRFYKQLSEVMQYPTSAREKGVTGKVLIEFVVEKDGKLTDIKVLKSLDEACDAEAQRALMVLAETLWFPAQLNGQYVRQKLILPITFSL